MIVKFSNPFFKDLCKIKDSILKNNLIQVIVLFENSENIEGISNIIKMKGQTEAYRMKIDKYRLGFYFDGATIKLGRFAKINDIYKLFP
ncbi:plasmid stabilization protein [Flavobacterium psychrophilum]|uniref:hypothetical protein n=1 Tax=Flavobacterium psychrophilum TaxID=96345 RepID=UPI0006187975|nr:hypothetical protein [Flavobacterium psychrophilum]EKT4509480.1 plasmid stabilization protein [Flavobacterium psychrophilum]EKT4549513.1 plasmid stabilization protein [Flavobacterium psychrophilum]ELI6455561.1 plasmid stabilization protein [Flavobacterium psychrophilum]ELM3643271.1 plasmid stabilization protein [Flavobacterium psychrophilum]MCB6061184.1 plasmid stabilization protein [Flavobacterium psychrophilum]